MAELSARNGLNRCPHCGGSDIETDAKEGKLRCKYCKTLFDAKSNNELGGVEGMKGETRGAGADDIVPSEDVILTFKCPACGAEVVINTEESMNASCHWCRHIFSANEKISNGAVPDLVLPFKITKEEAIAKARAEVDSSNQMLKSEFRQAFRPEDIRGVYFPYMIVDVNAHSESSGKAEKTVGQNTTPPFTVDVYDISREFDLLVDDLTVESSASRLNQDTYVNSNNIINAILPFDTENATAWNANYLRGFASEKRNVNVNNLKEIVALQSGDMARREAKKTASEYDRGIRWDREHLGIKGTKWKAAYLPVWLYSYKDENETRIYYIAINARTGETVSCVPTYNKKGNNTDARHHHENETNVKIENLKQSDVKITTNTGVRSREINGKNDTRVIGSLSHGRDEMLASEKARFANGANYSRARQRKDMTLVTVIKWILIIIVLLAIFFSGGGGGGSSSDSSWDSGSSWDSSSSWDSDSSWDSGGSSDSGGFDYSYDY